MRRSTLVAIFIAIILIAGGALALTQRTNNSNNTSKSTNNSASSSSSQVPSAGTIIIKNMMFTPSQITVAKGGMVTWTNNDSTAHTVIDDLNNVGGPASGEIAPGRTYTFTFNKAGSFQYHCRIHPSMRGTIVVK